MILEFYVVALALVNADKYPEACDEPFGDDSPMPASSVSEVNAFGSCGDPHLSELAKVLIT